MNFEQVAVTPKQYTVFPAPSLKPASGLVSKQRETDEGHIQSVKPCCGALEASIDSWFPPRSALNVRCPMTQWIEPSRLSSSVRKAARRKKKKATTGTLFLTSTTRLSSSLMVGWPVQTLVFCCFFLLQDALYMLHVCFFRSLQPHCEEAEASGHLSHYGENAKGDPRQDHWQLQQEATATIQVCDVLIRALIHFLWTEVNFK